MHAYDCDECFENKKSSCSIFLEYSDNNYKITKIKNEKQIGYTCFRLVLDIKIGLFVIFICYTTSSIFDKCQT